MFICVNTVSLLFIGASYIKMLRAIKQTSAEAMRPTLSGRENIVARRFAVIVATDCACWLPIIIVKMAALTGEAGEWNLSWIQTPPSIVVVRLLLLLRLLEQTAWRPTNKCLPLTPTSHRVAIQQKRCLGNR